MLSLWMRVVVFFLFSVQVRLVSSCNKEGEGYLSYFRTEERVYNVIYGEGVVKEIDFQKEELLVFFEDFGQKRLVAKKLSVLCGCLEGICVGDRVRHLWWSGRAKAWAVNHFYGRIIVRFFFNNEYLASLPERLRVLKSP